MIIFESYRNMDFLYGNDLKIYMSIQFKIQKQIQKLEYSITKEFQDGFGID